MDSGGGRPWGKGAWMLYHVLEIDLSCAYSIDRNRQIYFLPECYDGTFEIVDLS